MTDADLHLLTLFSAAMDHAPGPERDAYVDQVCAPDPALRARLDGLLRAHQHGGRFLERGEPGAAPTGDFPATGAAIKAPLTAGTVIAGRYKLLEEIGEGGMGSVWMAEQT